MKKGRCYKCGQNLTEADYGRQNTCPGCRSDTHICRNCIHFDPAYNNQCKENQADRVVEKDRANFCDYFSPSATGGTGGSKEDALKNAAEALFKKKL